MIDVMETKILRNQTKKDLESYWFCIQLNVMFVELLDAWIVSWKHDFVKKCSVFERFREEKNSW
jgi:hypothetical protein